MLPERIREVYAKSTRLYTKDDIEAALDEMALQINQELAGANPIFLCVAIGGIVPMGNLLPRLDMHLEVDYIHATRYRGATSGGELLWKAEPSVSLAGRNVVIVDDILDEGVTLKAIIDYCYQKGAKKVYTAILLDKKKPRLVEGVDKADFCALDVEQQHYVFGYGMDYEEYLRNVPGIYSVAKEHK